MQCFQPILYRNPHKSQTKGKLSVCSMKWNSERETKGRVTLKETAKYLQLQFKNIYS